MCGAVWVRRRSSRSSPEAVEQGRRNVVERTGELGIPVADEEPEAAKPLPHCQFSRLLSDPRRVGVPGESEDERATGRDLSRCLCGSEPPDRARHGDLPGIAGPGDGRPPVVRGLAPRYAEGTKFQIGRISMVANTGTYLDAPALRHRGGTDLARVGSCTTGQPSRCRRRRDGCRAARHPGPRARAVRRVWPAVLFRTGWDRHWRTEAYGSADAPYVTLSAVEWLVAHNAALVGIDSVNIDSAATRNGPPTRCCWPPGFRCWST